MKKRSEDNHLYAETETAPGSNRKSEQKNTQLRNPEQRVNHINSHGESGKIPKQRRKMNRENLLPLNLQYFAEDVDNESPEVVEPEEDESVLEDGEESEEEETGEGEEAESTDQPEHVQTAEENANYANIRRKAEADARRRFDEQQRMIDAQYAQMFQGYTNPETGAPILSASDYIAAMAAQERQTARAQMAEAGIDANSLNKLIENNPTVMQAKQAIATINEQNADRMLQEDFESILAIDPEIGSIDAIPTTQGYSDAVQYTIDHPGIRLAEAYKLVNFDRLANRKTAAAKQAAINAQKSKEHLSKTAGIAANNTAEEIPAGDIEKWKDWFPDKSMKELKKLYNKAIGG